MLALLTFSVAALGLIIYAFEMVEDVPVVPLLICVVIFGLLFLYVLLFELKTKALKVFINGGEIQTINFLGFGKECQYDLKDFEGYVTSFLRTKYHTYEYLFLVKGERRLHVSSDYYHKNYVEIKDDISTKCMFIGKEKYSSRRFFEDVLRS